MQTIPLSSLVPNADDLLALEVEEVAGILLVILNSIVDDGGGALISKGRISQNTFFGELERSPFYPIRKEEVRNALMKRGAGSKARGFSCAILTMTGSWFRDAQSACSRETTSPHTVRRACFRRGNFIR
jgi:hypothetical protein